MAVVLGLAVSIAYGAADFFGGLAARRSPLAGVVVLSQLISLPGIALLVAITDGSPDATTLIIGPVAGMCGGLGLTCLYGGLARGRMSVVAPITAVGAAALPVLWGLATGERPSAVALVGVGVALVAVVFVSRIEGDEAEAAGGMAVLLMAAVAGVGFGAVFILLAEGGEDTGLWPLLVMRMTSVGVLGLGAIVTKRPMAPGGAAEVRILVATGLLDMTANVLYVFATRTGLLSLVAVLSSLYPAATVVLARIVLTERLGRMQTVGLGLAAGGVVLIAAG